MHESYRVNKKPLLNKDQTVGVIANFFTEQLLKRDFKTKKMLINDVLDLLEENMIEVVFIECNIYEEDHDWYGYSFKEMADYIEKFNVNVIAVNSDQLENYNDYFQLNFSSKHKECEIEGNIISMPLMLNEYMFNPIETHRKKHDILFFSLGEPAEDKILNQFLKREKPKYDEIISPKITRSTLKELIRKIKLSKVLYIYYSDDFDKKLLKYIELSAVLQNTILILDPHFTYQMNYAFVSPDIESNANYLQTFINEGLYTDKKIIKSNRQAFLNNTLMQLPSLDEILNGNLDKKKIEVSVITSTKRKWTINEYIERINKQRHVDIQVILLTHGFELSVEEQQNIVEKANFEIKIINEDSSVIFGVCLNKCIDYATKEYFAKIDDDDFYYPNYLLDSWISQNYSNADIVGIYSQFVYLESEDLTIQRFKSHKNRYSEYVAGATIFCETELIKKYMFSEIPKAVDSDLLRRVLSKNGKIYCGHPYEFCIFRADDKTAHTWTVPDTHLLRSSEILFYGDPTDSLSIN
ncbi:glycosyltransferase [Salinicoccus sp. Marseille-QA3877]